MDCASESIGAFSKIFPDEASCVRWMLDVRFGLNTPCGLCGEFAAWRYQGSSSKYFRHCCRRIYPRVGTLAAFTSVPLRTWFFGIMLVSNFDGRVSTDFLARHLGLGVIAARRVSLRIRLHMTALALRESCPLEGPVYVDEMFLSAVSNAQRELDTLQAKIDALEQEQAALHAELADANLYAKDPARATELYARDAAIEEEMLIAMARWEDLSGS